MRETRRAITTAVCLVAAAAVVATGAAPAASTQQGDGTAPRPGAAVQSSVDPDVVVMRAEVAADGTARWSVAYRTRLDDENTTAAFESLRADIEANRSAFTEQFATGMRRTVRSAENRTGREMALRNVTVEASVQQFGQEYGVVTYRFTWTAFATVEGDRLRIGDALSGLFLDSETSLVVAYPERYAVESVTPAPADNRSNAVVWRGQIDFGPSQPRLVVAPGTDGGGDGSDGNGAGGSNTALFAGVAVGLLALLAVGYLLLVRGRGEGAGDEGILAGAADDGGGGGSGGDEPDEPPEELLSNEERVLRLLEDNGGRVKQQQIADEFDWTDAKTSQVVGNLREEDEVETFRIGRENVVALPEESDL